MWELVGLLRHAGPGLADVSFFSKFAFYVPTPGILDAGHNLRIPWGQCGSLTSCSAGPLLNPSHRSLLKLYSFFICFRDHLRGWYAMNGLENLLGGTLVGLVTSSS